MTRALKLTITIVIILGAIAGLRQYVAGPYSCNVRLRRATQRVEAIFALVDNVRAAELARQIVRDMQSCVRTHPEDVGAQMVLAAAYRTFGQNRQAAAAYQTALRYDRRPELYFNLGQTQLAMGDRKAALQNLTLACIYNPKYLDDISEYHPEVKRAVDEYQLQMMQASR